MVSLIGFPRMEQSLRIMAEHQTVSAVAAQLRMARAQALRRDRTVVFDVSPDGTAYGDRSGRLAPVAPGVVVDASGAPGRRIAFYGDGSSSGGVILVRGANRRIRVAVQPSGGAVSVTP